MRAISVKQPWAWLLASGFKDIENRSWPTYVRGRVMIHAGKVPDPFFDYARAERLIGRPIPRDLPLGAVVGEMNINDCVEESDSPWFFGPFGFVVSHASLYECPIPYRGQLGFFEGPRRDEGHA